MPESILLIDDDLEALRQLGEVFDRTGAEVARELDIETGLAACERLRPDVVLFDFGCPGADGALARLRERHAAVILVVDEGEQARATTAVQAGAEAFLVRPVDVQLLRATVTRVAEKVRLRRLTELLLLDSGPGAGLSSLGDSPAMRELVRIAGQAATVDGSPVLLQGEPGVGKAWLARVMHRMSRRARSAFISVRCRGVAPSELIERLFGSEQVSPGGARERRPGLVENGAGGTIYFHELGDLPLELQPALLKLLESGTFRRVGGVRDLQADVRIMAGSSRPLAALVEGDIIGEDLGYRLNAMPVTIPPVRSRHRDDRLTLLMTVADRLRDGAPDAPPDFTADALDRLVAHSWPGNVTEMGQVLGRALLLAREAEAVGLEHLPGELRNRAGPGDRRHTPMTLDALERSHIERTLRHHGGNRTKAAQELGISRATLINKIKRYSLER